MKTPHFIKLALATFALFPLIASAGDNESQGQNLTQRELDWDPSRLENLMRHRARTHSVLDRMDINGLRVWSRETMVRDGTPLSITFNVNLRRSIPTDNNPDHDILASQYIVHCRTIQHVTAHLTIHEDGSFEMQRCNVLDRNNNNQSVDAGTQNRLLRYFGLPQRYLYIQDLTWHATPVGPSQIPSRPRNNSADVQIGRASCRERV